MLHNDLINADGALLVWRTYQPRWSSFSRPSALGCQVMSEPSFDTSTKLKISVIRNLSEELYFKHVLRLQTKGARSVLIVKIISINSLRARSPIQSSYQHKKRSIAPFFLRDDTCTPSRVLTVRGDSELPAWWWTRKIVDSGYVISCQLKILISLNDKPSRDSLLGLIPLDLDDKRKNLVVDESVGVVCVECVVARLFV